MNTSNTINCYSIGDKYKLFYNSNNPNNNKIEIRAIIDDVMVVVRTENGIYKMEHVDWFDFNIENGKLTKLNK